MAEYKIKKVEVDDSHYYYVQDDKGVWNFYPSVTKILSVLPKPGLTKWIGNLGNTEAEKIVNQAAKRGTMIHAACEALLSQQKIKLHEAFPDRIDQKCIVAFIDWFNEYKPEIKSIDHLEMVVASNRYKFAGTLDIFCYIDGKPFIIDIKTSNSVHDSHRLQLMAYRYAFYEMTGIKANVAILHLNYRTKKGYTFYLEGSKRANFDIKGKKATFQDFMTVYRLYTMINRGIPEPPKRLVYPEVVSLNILKKKDDKQDQNSRS